MSYLNPDTSAIDVYLSENEKNFLNILERTQYWNVWRRYRTCIAIGFPCVLPDFMDPNRPVDSLIEKHRPKPAKARKRRLPARQPPAKRGRIAAGTTENSAPATLPSDSVRRSARPAKPVKKLNPADVYGSEDESDEAKENAKSQDTGLKPKGTDVLVMLLRLRQACCHFGLMKEAIDISALQEVDGAATDGDKLADRLNDMSLVDEAVQDLGEVAAEREEAIKRLFKRRVPSTKVQAVLDCIQTILAEPRHESGYASKCVVVGQWVTFLDILGAQLQQMQIPYMSITGQVDAAERNKIVERFNEKGGRRVLFISITAGGVGLNLIGGNHLLLVDIHWNPSLEDQACDRIHRMGQKREIFVHKFVTKNTIEQRVIDIQNAKKQLATNLLSG